MKIFGDVTAKEFVIFRAGTWNGETFTEADLDEMAKNFNEQEAPHIILGHSTDYKGKTLIPSFGRILGGLKRVGKDLVAVGTVFNENMAGWIRDGFFPQRSVEMTKDNKRILAVAMLGAMPPAVKGMDMMQYALKDSALAFSDVSDSRVIEFVEDGAVELTAIDEIEKKAQEDTLKSVSECCALFIKNVEALLADDKYDGDRLMAEVWELQGDLARELNLHGQFIQKIEQIEEAQEEYSHKDYWKEFASKIKSLFNNRKEQDEMEKQKEEGYQKQIADLEAKVKEFADAEAKRAEDARVAAELAADETLKQSIKVFCDSKIAEHKMTPAMREKDEAVMFTLGKTSPDALKAFQEKYDHVVVPKGETDSGKSKGEQGGSPLIAKARAFVKDNPKMFAGLDADTAVSRAIYMEANNEITFK